MDNVVDIRDYMQSIVNRRRWANRLVIAVSVVLIVAAVVLAQ